MTKDAHAIMGKAAETAIVTAAKKARASDWASKIARARQARESAKAARKGKPATFPNRLVP